jgi:hypothetical protein
MLRTRGRQQAPRGERALRVYAAPPSCLPFVAAAVAAPCRYIYPWRREQRRQKGRKRQEAPQPPYAIAMQRTCRRPAVSRPPPCQHAHAIARSPASAPPSAYARYQTTLRQNAVFTVVHSPPRLIFSAKNPRSPCQRCGTRESSCHAVHQKGEGVHPPIQYSASRARGAYL